MKNAKKVFAMLIVLALAISMAIPVSAEEVVPTGTITISGAVNGQTYSAYKMADLKRAGDAYSYTVADKWEAFFNQDAVKEVYTVDANGVITEVSKDAAKLATVAKLAVVFAKNSSNNITGTEVTAENNTAAFEDLPYGYYCVDTTTGTVCSIGSVDGADVTIVEKNTVPHIDKSIVEGNQKLNVSDAYIGQVVKFEVVVDAYNGAENYIITDTLSPGLTFVKDENGTALAGTDKLSDFITITTKINPNPISIDLSADSQSSRNGNTIVIDLLGEDVLTKDLLKGVSTPITLTYYAKVNAQAEIDGPNPNTVSLKYGNNSDANSDEVNLYPLSFNIAKVDGSNSNAPLAGAKFKIYRLIDQSTKQYLVLTGSAGAYKYEDVTEDVDEATEIVASIAPVGEYVIEGLEEGTYYIEETVAPTGYNAITAPSTITIGLDKNQDTASATVTYGQGQTQTVTIANFTGAVLPSTGATGTIIFITVGGLMVVAMGVLLVVRKRMSKVVYTR